MWAILRFSLGLLSEAKLRIGDPSEAEVCETYVALSGIIDVGINAAL